MLGTLLLLLPILIILEAKSSMLKNDGAMPPSVALTEEVEGVECVAGWRTALQAQVDVVVMQIKMVVVEASLLVAEAETSLLGAVVACPKLHNKRQILLDAQESRGSNSTNNISSKFIQLSRNSLVLPWKRWT